MHLFQYQSKYWKLNFKYVWSFEKCETKSLIQVFTWHRVKSNRQALICLCGQKEWKMTWVTSPIGCLLKIEKKNDSFHWLCHDYFACKAAKICKIKTRSSNKKKCRCRLAVLTFPASSQMPPWLAAVIATHLYFAWPYGEAALPSDEHMSHADTLPGGPPRRAEPSRFRCLHPPTAKLPAHGATLRQPRRISIGASKFSREDPRCRLGQRSRSGSAERIKKGDNMRRGE